MSAIKAFLALFANSTRLVRTNADTIIKWAATNGGYVLRVGDDGVVDASGPYFQIAYRIAEVRKRIADGGINKEITSYERAFKRMEPYSPEVIQTTHGQQPLKIWEFRPTSERGPRKKEKKMSRKRPERSTSEDEAEDPDYAGHVALTPLVDPTEPVYVPPKPFSYMKYEEYPPETIESFEEFINIDVSLGDD